MSLALCCAADDRAESGRVVTRQERSTPGGSVGSVHGYRVEASFDCRFLRAESPGERLVIREAERPPDVDGEPLLAWSPRPLRDFEAKLFTTDNGYVFWTSREGWFDIDPREPSIAVTPVLDRVRREARLWGVPSLLCYLTRGDVPLHAAAVDVDGRALLLAGPGRSGCRLPARLPRRARIPRADSRRASRYRPLSGPPAGSGGGTSRRPAQGWPAPPWYGAA